MISYAHADADLCAELKTWLVSFEREQRVTFWSDHAIDAGDQWYPAILDSLNAADVVLLLLSQPFFASQFIHDHELPLIKTRRDAGALTVVPIRLRLHNSPATATYTWLRDEQQIPRDGRVVTCRTQRDQRDRDQAWHEVIGELARSLTRIEDQRSAGIVSRSTVDSEIVEVRIGALDRALHIVRQVPDDLGGIARADVEAALAQAATALDADPLAFADQVASAVNRLRRCRVPRSEHEALSNALDALRGRLGDLFETAREAGYPTTATSGVPAAKTVPQSQIAEVRAVVETRLDALEAKIDALAAERQGTPEAAATDAAITEVVDDVKGQAAVARTLIAEPQVDVAGVTAAVDGAARAAGRFVRRVAGVASAALRTAAAGIEAAATVLVAAGRAFTAAARGEGLPAAPDRTVPAEVAPPPAEPQPPPELISVLVQTAKGKEIIHRVPGAGQAFQDVVEVNGRRIAGPEMVVVPAGSFMMGSPDGEGNDGERPQHKVTIARPFAVGRFVVTFDEWDAAVAAGGVSHKPADQGWGRGRRPVINVSWEDARAYCKWLSEVTGQTYRLLSEAEWEYACRAVTSPSSPHPKYYFGDDEAQLVVHAWYSANSGRKTHPVGEKAPNAWGLHDKHGNVREWCEDFWHDSYTGAPSNGSASAGAADTHLRVVRSGSWYSFPRTLGAAKRSGNTTDYRFNYLGFRVARLLSSPTIR